MTCFFIIPVILVAWMSAHGCKLLTCTIPNPGHSTFPTTLVRERQRPLLAGRLLHIEYTVLATVLLIGMGLGLALLVQKGGRWVSVLRTSFLVPGALGLATASLLFWGFYSGSIGPFNPLMDGSTAWARSSGS